MDTSLSVLAIVGLVAISAITRSFFLLSEREWELPLWLQSGLRFAPLTALVAVVAPEVVLSDGQLLHTVADARLWAVAAAIALYFWRRSLLVTIVGGMVVLVFARLVLGW